MKEIKIKNENGEWVTTEISEDSFKNIAKNIKPKFKVGDWVIVQSANQCGEGNGVFKNNWFSRLYDKNDGPATGMLDHEADFIVDNSPEGLSSRVKIKKSHIIRLATEEEIKAYLIKEAERRGYEDGVKVKCLVGGLVEELDLGFNGYDYGGDDGFWYDDTCIYHNGKWAEIIKDNTIQIGDYEAEYTGERVKVGCQVVNFATVKELYKAMKKLR